MVVAQVAIRRGLVGDSERFLDVLDDSETVSLISSAQPLVHLRVIDGLQHQQYRRQNRAAVNRAAIRVDPDAGSVA